MIFYVHSCSSCGVSECGRACGDAAVWLHCRHVRCGCMHARLLAACLQQAWRCVATVVLLLGMCGGTLQYGRQPRWLFRGSTLRCVSLPACRSACGTVVPMLGIDLLLWVPRCDHQWLATRSGVRALPSTAAAPRQYYECHHTFVVSVCTFMARGGKVLQNRTRRRTLFGYLLLARRFDHAVIYECFTRTAVHKQRCLQRATQYRCSKRGLGLLNHAVTAFVTGVCAYTAQCLCTKNHVSQR